MKTTITVSTPAPSLCRALFSLFGVLSRYAQQPLAEDETLWRRCARSVSSNCEVTRVCRVERLLDALFWSTVVSTNGGKNTMEDSTSSFALQANSYWWITAHLTSFLVRCCLPCLFFFLSFKQVCIVLQQPAFQYFWLLISLKPLYKSKPDICNPQTCVTASSHFQRVFVPIIII